MSLRDGVVFGRLFGSGISAADRHRNREQDLLDWQEANINTLHRQYGEHMADRNPTHFDEWCREKKGGE